MARHTEITLDDAVYKVPTLSIDQLERLTELQGEPNVAKAAFGMLKIILEDVEPKIEGKARASMEEATGAINAVMGNAGVINAAGNPPLAVVKAAE